MLVVISNGIVVQASKRDVGGRKDGEVKSSVLLHSKTFCEWKICNCGRRETEETICMSKVREGNK